MTSWTHLEGRVTNVASRKLADGRTEYKIRLSVPKKPYEAKHEVKKKGKDAQVSEPIEFVAYGDEHYDPWCVLGVGDDCIVEGECLEEPSEWHETAKDGKPKTNFVRVVGRFVRAKWLDECYGDKKPNLDVRMQIERHTPSDAELPDED